MVRRHRLGRNHEQPLHRWNRLVTPPDGRRIRRDVAGWRAGADRDRPRSRPAPGVPKRHVRGAGPDRRRRRGSRPRQARPLHRPRVRRGGGAGPAAVQWAADPSTFDDAPFGAAFPPGIAFTVVFGLLIVLTARWWWHAVFGALIAFRIAGIGTRRRGPQHDQSPVPRGSPRPDRVRLSERWSNVRERLVKRDAGHAVGPQEAARTWSRMCSAHVSGESTGLKCPVFSMMCRS